jgi:multidrug efflux pump subunit AcrB
MNISKFFIDRPIFAGVLSTLVLVAGLISLFQLPISEYPEVIRPSVIDHARYPGANPKVIAEFFGMIGVTMFGLMLTPVFYVLLRKVAGQQATDQRAPQELSHRRPQRGGGSERLK